MHPTQFSQDLDIVPERCPRSSALSFFSGRYDLLKGSSLSIPLYNASPIFEALFHDDFEKNWTYCHRSWNKPARLTHLWSIGDLVLVPCHNVSLNGSEPEYAVSIEMSGRITLGNVFDDAYRRLSDSLTTIGREYLQQQMRVTMLWVRIMLCHLRSWCQIRNVWLSSGG